MNSRATDFAYTFMNPEKGEALAEIKKHHVEQLPIHTIDFSNPEDVARHDRMVDLVERMLSLHERLAGARIERERTVIGHNTGSACSLTASKRQRKVMSAKRSV